MITIQERPVPLHTVHVSPENESVLEIDVATAWQDMKLESRWSNEVQVKILFTA
jgi:hypothetical protein